MNIPQITLEQYEQLQPHAVVDGIMFMTPNTHCAWRVDTLYTKEPCTIAWINKMAPGETLFDVGACMGGYTCYAASKGIKVHAFEPEAQNFALLCRNIALNKFTDVTAWPIAISNRPSTDVLHLSSILAGGSCHSFSESKDYKGNDRVFPFKQGSISSTIDLFAAKYGYPDHIKIDVDGFEHLVLEGAAMTLRKAKSVLVETNTNYDIHHDYIMRIMSINGFTFDETQAESSRRKDGPFVGVGNIIFYKGQS